MNEFLNLMRLHAQLAQQGATTTSRIGIVDAYDSNYYACKVRIQPEDVLSGWLPVQSLWVGNNWGLFCPPSIGDVVDVHFHEGSSTAAYVALRWFNDRARPLPTPSGEFWVVHKSGSALKFHNDGSVDLITNKNLNATVGQDLVANITGNLTATIGGQANLTVTGKVVGSASEWDITGNMIITGNLTTTGSITDQNGLHGTLQHVRDNYNSHTHPGVQTGLGSTGTTSLPIT